MNPPSIYGEAPGPWLRSAPPPRRCSRASDSDKDILLHRNIRGQVNCWLPGAQAEQAASMVLAQYMRLNVTRQAAGQRLRVMRAVCGSLKRFEEESIVRWPEAAAVQRPWPCKARTVERRRLAGPRSNLYATCRRMYR